MKKLPYILTFLILTNFVKAQNSLDDIDVIFQNDFEQNTLGDYQYSEWLEDWNYPPWNSRRSTCDIVQDEDADNSTKVLQGYYPLGSVGPSEGGFQWWTSLDEGYDELYFSYDVYLMPGFQPQLGGKIPGLHGGNPYYSPPIDGTDYFQASMMFSEASSDVRIQFYAYYVDQKLTTNYGDTYYWGYEYSDTYFDPSHLVIEYAKGDFAFITPGEWHNITYRVSLNTVTGGVGNYDGVMEGYFDGVLYTQISNLQWRNDEDLQIDVIKFYTFFGGNTEAWASPISQWALFDNVLLYKYKSDSIEAPQGNNLSPTDRTINYWRNFGEEEEPPTASFDSVKINFCDDDITQSTGNWNNLNTRILGTTHADLIDSDGDATEIDLYINMTSDNLYSTTTGYYPGLYPDSVMRVAWRLSAGETGSIQLQDLDTDNTYKFEIFGSRNTTATQNNSYTISDTTKDLDVYDNDDETVSWIFSPSSSSLDITWTIAGKYPYLNSLVIIDLTEDAEETVNLDTLYVADTLFAAQVDSFYNCQEQIIDEDTCVGYLDSLDYFIWDTVNFGSTGVNRFLYRYIAHSSYLGEFYMTLDSINGDTIALWNTTSTGGWYTFGTKEINLLQTVTGVHDLYVHSNQYAGGDIHWILFYKKSWSYVKYRMGGLKITSGNNKYAIKEEE